MITAVFDNCWEMGGTGGSLFLIGF